MTISRAIRRAGAASVLLCLLIVVAGTPAAAGHKATHTKGGKAADNTDRADGAGNAKGGTDKGDKPTPPDQSNAGGNGKGKGGGTSTDVTTEETSGTSKIRGDVNKTAKQGPLAIGGGDIRIDYAAAAQHTYDHLTGDGADQFGTGVSGDQVVESLQGKDFNCGDLVLWYAAVSVDPAAVGTAAIEIDISWSAEPSGQDGAGFTEVTSAFINDNDSGNVNLDGNESVSLVSTSTGISEGKQNVFGTVAVTGLDAGDQVIAAMLTRITCWLPSPTGNLFSRIQAARMTAPAADNINVGAQTITLKRVEDLGNLPGGGPGTITIVKNAVPNAPADFGFSGDLGPFDLDDDLASLMPSRRVFTNLAAGTYSVVEDAAPGWRLTGLRCTDATGGTTASVVNRRASIGLAGGDEVVCTFTNTRITPPSDDADEDGLLTRPATKVQGRRTAGLPYTGGGFSNFFGIAILLLLVGTSLIATARRRKNIIPAT